MIKFYKKIENSHKKLWLIDCENVESDEIVMEVCEKSKKGEHFLEILGKLHAKFEQNFIEILTKFLRKFLEKIVQILGKFSGMNVAKVLRKYLR